MPLIAKLVITNIVTRVIVEDNATKDQILNAAKVLIIESINEDLEQHVEEIMDDTEQPYNNNNDVEAENMCDRILIRDPKLGRNLFEGSREEFERCFNFSNPTDKNIHNWSSSNGYILAIDNR